MQIIRDGRLEVDVLLPEKNLRAISSGQSATIVDASGRTIEGKVSSIAETVDPITRPGTVYVALGDDLGLKPGMSARVLIETSAEQQISVAETALVWHDGEPAVFVVADDGKVSARNVETGVRQNGRVAVAAELAEGEQVVIAGSGFLNDGDLVRIATSEANIATSEGDDE